ncbi:hypothetical protein GCM10022243_11120 [Saccharothrix violaceirubra]|uniref:Putative FmdB family regulatory protein n=1 Tax=Saccharothrix violaceirubra TaxID=413306 RepID=A0A7W7WYJ6_9PSEU|nr:FmdB family zinc ribbon protein [Saccharothrix violaceirubra]MBB4968614.1 putative FmdB family regulatory protein [Saccharothrix violaceirubra]
MPTYQYACTECDHRFEAVQSFSDAALAECPQCTGRLRKLYGAVGVVFKGSGFYRTDNRSSATGSSSTTTSAKTESTSSASTKSESTSSTAAAS